jgi:hypothetical protein
VEQALAERAETASPVHRPGQTDTASSGGGGRG